MKGAVVMAIILDLFVGKIKKKRSMKLIARADIVAITEKGEMKMTRRPVKTICARQRSFVTLGLVS